MNIGGISIDVGDAVALIELAGKLGANIYAAIESHGGYSDEQKADLVRRVKAAGNYRPRDLDAERNALLTARQKWAIDRANGRRLDEPMPPAEAGDAVPEPAPTPKAR